MASNHTITCNCKRTVLTAYINTTIRWNCQRLTIQVKSDDLISNSNILSNIRQQLYSIAINCSINCILYRGKLITTQLSSRSTSRVSNHNVLAIQFNGLITRCHILRNILCKCTTGNFNVTNGTHYTTIKDTTSNLSEMFTMFFIGTGATSISAVNYCVNILGIKCTAINSCHMMVLKCRLCMVTKAAIINSQGSIIIILYCVQATDKCTTINYHLRIRYAIQRCSIAIIIAVFEHTGMMTIIFNGYTTIDCHATMIQHSIEGIGACIISIDTIFRRSLISTTL